ncbi:MAG: hypothetical protein F6K54_28000 [Okeania sp. SIO3B5]|uniref:hypothetical protein n=1 Tax=Okeania sp. SIO3B5 TaxID=2607811 RepID=UPI0014012F19|nr:hypothetical protein [Okeania sp. SIO3B5]NEO56581.1 hypothetical protein [Okeania sp. SIO3B5]
MQERISEPISKSFLIPITGAGLNNTIIDFDNEERRHDSAAANRSFLNTNFIMNHLSVSYILPSLAPKPSREYSLTDSDLKERADEIEYERKYNDATFDEDGKPYASKLVLFKRRLGVNQVLGHKLLYNSYHVKTRDNKPHFTREHQNLMDIIGTPIMNSEFSLRAYLTRFEEGDEIVISASYTGNINYTFDSGVATHHLIFPGQEE